MKEYSGIILISLFFLFLEFTFIFGDASSNIFLSIVQLYNNSPIKCLTYSLIFISSVVAIVIIPFFNNGYIVVLTGLVITFSYILDFSYLNITGRGVSIADLTILLHEFQNYSWQAFDTYTTEIIIGLLLGIGILICFYVSRKITTMRIPSYFAIILIFSVLLATALQSKTAASFSLRIPSPQKILSYLAYWYSYQPYYGDRKELHIKPELPRKYTNIIWIVDCSVNANYLGINDSVYNTTPFLENISNQYINIGSVASVTNCSAISNIYLMGMGKKNDLPDLEENLLKNPSIFAYAKNAGYKTAYISAQSQGNRFQNYMSDFDLEDIDYFHQPTTAEEKDPVYADEYLANHIKKHLKKNEGSFIYVVKSGAHFPWQNNYPTEQDRFGPSLKNNEDISDVDYPTRLNTYLNVLYWKTDHFFSTLLSNPNILNHTLMIYTSDHGQVIPQGDYRQTHCSTKNPHIQEGIVPLIYFSSDLSKIQHSKSIFQLIPVTLDIMGYSPDVSEINSYTELEVPGFFYGHLFPKNPLQQYGIKLTIDE